MIPLGGTGIGSVLQLSNTSWTFAPHPVGQRSGNGVIYIYNPGPGLVKFGNTGFSGGSNGPFDFSLINNTCGSLLTPYKTCALTFNFHPSMPAQQAVSLNLYDNSTNGPIQIPVYGYGY